MTSYKGTKRGYMAPEIHACLSSPTNKYDAKAADIFALGVMLYAVVMGRLPFEHARLEDPHYKLLTTDDPAPFWTMQTAILAKL